jgi:hypothetical protein
MTARYSTVRQDEQEAAVGKIISLTAARRVRFASPPASPVDRTDVHASAP